jgi:hypothetical protein
VTKINYLFEIPTAMNEKVTVFWDMTSCPLIFFYQEEEDSTFLRDVGNDLPD